ncbi:MAG: NAD(P)-binding domain-containing protein [Candidatus Binatus sp.]|uniref:NAD(P)-binding domain-containing protein n=1 Tax=Candidatus Binatus sp. TaxID=2811406 RepID=UPI00271E2082|nr:NAD(P)-binding domain-containing protein [Candidatus Binatus sp.]MDO8432673.1 NAD(P)-binding domain-containing protein [Candidatus Binatus sp.]
MSSRSDVAIIGAGPYGLSAAAHLRAAGVEARVFGRTMDFWEGHMPAGMRLRSSWDASHISDPQRRLTLENYQCANRVKLDTPLPLSGFIDYGRWFQREAAPDADPRRVHLVERDANCFRLRLEDGELIEARRVVIATGILPFAYRPPEFDEIPCTLASHSCNHRDLAAFAGRKVTVVGGGQSALESAALLAEAGAQVAVVTRAPGVRWLTRSGRLHRLPARVRRLLYHPTDVGPALLSQLVARPTLFRLLPRDLQEHIAWRSIRPAASSWLMPRVTMVRFTYGRRITNVIRVRDRLRLHLDDGSSRETEHVILATGYRVDIRRYCFLAPELLSAMRVVDGYPELKTGLESSVAGLHFLGAPAARSFGPLVRFVSGAHFASSALTARITNRRAPESVP